MERFWNRVKKDGPVILEELGPCWMWIGKTNKDGYGKIKLNGKTKLVHRVSFCLTHSEIPNGLMVLHKCDNPPCCNPAHLFTGTAADNANDRDFKGRQAKGDKNGSRLHPELLSRGERHSNIMYRVAARGMRNGRYTHPERTARGERSANSKLNDSAVLEMRALHATGLSYAEISRRFGVAPINARFAIIGRTWKHVK